MSDLSSFVQRLESVAADIDELAFDQLREAVADGAGERPAGDKKLMQARRAIEKAARLLRELDDGAGSGWIDDDWDGPAH
jgi:hypothetical protein